jgi:hypothetical protein
MPPDSDDTAAPASWRERITVHPAADLFPGMSDDELRQLGEDIRAHDLQVPVVFLADRLTLIDGRNRLDAMERAGLPIFNDDGGVKVRFETAKEVDPVVYVVSANLHRRHLTAEQRDILIRRLRAERPQLSVRGIAAATHTPKSTVARALAEPAVPSGTRERVTGRDGKSYPGKGKGTPKLKIPPAQLRAKAIVDFAALLHRQPFNTLEDLVRILADERRQIAAMPREKRVALARGYLMALGIDLNDLRPDDDTL